MQINKHYRSPVRCSDEEGPFSLWGCVQAHGPSCHLGLQAHGSHASFCNCVKCEAACQPVYLRASLLNCMQACATACKIVQLHASSFMFLCSSESVQAYVIICGLVALYASLCNCMQAYVLYAGLCNCMQAFATVCKLYASLCNCMQVYATVCELMQLYASICMHSCLLSCMQACVPNTGL